MPAKKKEVDLEWLENQARAGRGRAQIAKDLGLTPSGFASLLDRREDLREAFDTGTRLAYEDLLLAMREIALDPKEKANVKVQAFDKWARHSEVERTKQLQTAAVGHLNDSEVQALRENLAKQELAERLSKASKQEPAQVRDAEEPEKVEVKDGE